MAAKRVVCAASAAIMLSSILDKFCDAVELGEVRDFSKAMLEFKVCKASSEVKNPCISLFNSTEQTPTLVARAVASPRSIASSIVDLTRSISTNWYPATCSDEAWIGNEVKRELMSDGATGPLITAFEMTIRSSRTIPEPDPITSSSSAPKNLSSAVKP